MEIPKRQLPLPTGRACQGVCVYSDVMDHRVRGIISVVIAIEILADRVSKIWC